MTFPNLADLLTLTPPHTSLCLHQSCQVLAAVRITMQLILSCICICIYQYIYVHILTLAQWPHSAHHKRATVISTQLACHGPSFASHTASRRHGASPAGRSHCFRISQGSHPFTPQLEPVSSRAGRPACRCAAECSFRPVPGPPSTPTPTPTPSLSASLQLQLRRRDVSESCKWL